MCRAGESPRIASGGRGVLAQVRRGGPTGCGGRAILQTGSVGAVEIVLTGIGLFAFAASGALMAVRRDMDIIGVGVLALATALGGGVLRDVLIGIPPTAIRIPWWLVVVGAAALLTFFFHSAVNRLWRGVLVCDAIGLGLFCATSTALALQHGIHPLGAVMVGTIGGVFGGMVRDVLAGEVPNVLRRETRLYASPAVGGCSLIVLADLAGLQRPWVVAVAAAAIVGLRLLALWRGWKAPAPRVL